MAKRKNTPKSDAGSDTIKSEGGSNEIPVGGMAASCATKLHVIPLPLPRATVALLGEARSAAVAGDVTGMVIMPNQTTWTSANYGGYRLGTGANR